MSTQHGITRRAFLRLAGLCAAVGAVGPAQALASVGSGGPTLSGSQRARVEALAGLLGDRRSACRVGTAYLRHAPQEADVGCLLRDVCGQELAADPEVLKAAVARRMRSDFEHERVVVLDGWVVARTEARLCALALLA